MNLLEEQQRVKADTLTRLVQPPQEVGRTWDGYPLYPLHGYTLPVTS